MSSFSNQDEYYDYLLEWCKRGISSGPEFVRIEEILLEFGLESTAGFETKFCQALTAEVLARKAALEPELVMTNLVAPPDKEGLPFAEFRSAEIIISALKHKDWRLITEAFRILKNQKKRLHPWCLPATLDHLQSKAEFFPYLQYIMGERAFWLAAQRDEWKWWLDIHAKDSSNLESKDLLQWILWHRSSGNDLVSAITQLEDKDRKVLLSVAAKNPIAGDVYAARPYLSSRSVIERSFAWEILLKSDTEERKSLLDQVRIFCEQQIGKEKRNLVYREDDDRDLEVTPDGKIMLRGSQDFLPDPRLRLVALFPPQVIFGHLEMPVREICLELLLNRNLESICQVAVLSASMPMEVRDWQTSLTMIWMQEYPKRNTTEVDFSPLLQKVSFELYQQLIHQVLRMKGEYMLEKIALLARYTDQYLNQETSMKLIDTIIQLLDHRLSRKDNEFMIEALGNLSYQVDPRVNNRLVANWVDVAYMNKPLGEALWKFRNTIVKRSELLNSIIN